MKSLRIPILLIAVLLAGVALWTWHTPLRLLVLVATGKSPTCPVLQALKSDDNRQKLTAANDRIIRGSRLLQTDREHNLEQWSTPKGDFWIPMHNQYTLPFNLAEMERKVYGDGEHFIHPGDVVLDCGASDGDFTREALKAGAKLVVAVELAPLNIECLRRNLAREISAGQVIVYPKGVWDKEDTLTLNVVEGNFAADSVVKQPDGSHHGPTVPLTTIDRLAAELNLPRVDFIKMDVEGAESRAIAGARDILTRYKPRLAIAAEHDPDDEIAIPQAVRQVRSDYTMACGPCLESKGRVRVDVLYFF
jgi:FkbM family methyltransferase